MTNSFQISIVEIDSIEDPRIRPYCSLRKGMLQQDSGAGHFIAETFKVVALMLRAKVPTKSIFCTKEWLEKLYDEPGLLDAFTGSVYVADKSIMEAIVGFRLHQGLLAIAVRPQDVRPQDFIGPIVVFNNVVNPENVGSIVRTAVGLGIKNFLGDTASADPYLRRCVRVSMGNIFAAKVHRTRQLPLVLADLRARGYTVVGSDMEGETVPLWKYSFPSTQIALIIGGEVDGMTGSVLAECDAILNIPTELPGFAFNAAHSAAILCYALAAKSEC